MYRICVLISLVAMLCPLGCSTNGKPTETAVCLRADDIDALTGPAWVGTLTYLDYTSHQHTTIDSSLIVRRVNDSPPSWEFGVGYSKEPHADSKEVLSLSGDGRTLGEQHVLSRNPLPGGGVRFVTECDGEDDHRASRFRFEHTVTPHEYSRRKLVRFNGENEFFERHVYRWLRANEGSWSGPPTKRIAAADLGSDLSILRQAFENIHPGLYRYNTKEQMATHLAVLETAWGRDSTPSEAFLALAQFTAKIKCGHTFPNPSNQSKAVVAELFLRQDKVPFYFRWIDGRMIVTRDFTEAKQLTPGTEILALNDTPAHAVLERLMTIARADGSNDAKRVNLLEVTGSERYETFDIYFPILFPPKGPVFEFKIRPPAGSAEAIITTAALTYETRLAAHEAKNNAPEDGEQPLWRLSNLPDGTAYLPMASWVAYKTKWDWVGFINDTFDSLIERKVSNLVIDLRGNEGGSSVGDVILARLIEKPVPRSSSHRFVRYLKTPTELDAILDTWDPSFKDWSKEAIGPMELADRGTGLAPGTTGGFYRLRNENGKDPAESDQLISPRGPRFGGRVFVLVDASNSSATFEFASLVKSLKVGTLVGQPTGGNQRGINGGAFFFVRLPRTGFEVDLPIMAQFPPRNGAVADNAGIVPDVLVTPTVEDVAGGVDAEVREVQRLISSTR